MMSGEPLSDRRPVSARALQSLWLMALSSLFGAQLWAQDPQLRLPQFVSAELVTTGGAPLTAGQLFTFHGDKAWSDAKVTWRYPLHVEDEHLWGPSVPMTESARVVQERVAALKSFKLDELDPIPHSLIAPMRNVALQVEARGDDRPLSTATIKRLYPEGIPARVTQPLGAYLSSYSTLVANTWVLWLLTPRAHLREPDYARYARIFSTLKENARPQDRAILIEGEDAIESSSYVDLIEEWTPEMWTSAFRSSSAKRRGRSARGVARVDMLRSVMRNLIHKLSAGESLDTRCGQPCSHVIPNMNILIFADQIEGEDLRSIQSLVHSKTNIFYGAHLIQVRMEGSSAPEASLNPLSELRLPTGPTALPHVITQNSLSEVFKQINDWRDQRFVVQPVTEVPAYYWDEAGWELTAELFAQSLGLTGQVLVELPRLDRELSTPQLRQLKRFQSNLKALRVAEREAQSQRQLERALFGLGAVLIFLTWLALMWRKRSLQALQQAQVRGGEGVRPQQSEHDSAQPEEQAPPPAEALSDERAPWAERPAKEAPSPMSHMSEGDPSVAGPYIPTTSEQADAEPASAEDAHEIEVELESESELESAPARALVAEPEELDVLEGSSNPWYERHESAPPSEHGARLAGDDFIHYESDPPASTERPEQSELNTAPYGASIVIRVDEAALFAIQGPLKGKVFRVNRSPASVGRGRGVDCKLPPIDDLAISRRHCVILQKSPDAWEIICSSPAGLYVNDVLIREGETQTLYDKDLLTLGRSRFRFRLGPIGVEGYPRGRARA